MHPILDLAAVVLLGAVVFTAARFSRARHHAKFGPAPPGSNARTVLWFLGCSGALAVVAWWSRPAFWVLLVVMLISSQTVGGFRTRAWGPWQQFRDGALGAAVITAPLLAVALLIANG
jgi:hypothetical protein